jgi:hypothetical protein
MKITKVTLASFSDILYHSTSVNKVQEILKDKKIHMTSNLGTSADKLYKKEKFKPYYFSMSRVKFGGFAQTIGEEWIATLVMDGRALKEKYYGRSVDYWGEDWRKTADESAKKSGDKSRRLVYDENEDRIYSDKPFIEPLNKYIKEIHVMLCDLCIRNLKREKLSDSDHSKMYDMMCRYSDISKYSRSFGIPCYFYDNFSAFKVQNKKKAVDGYNRGNSNLQCLNNLFKMQVPKDIDTFDKDERDVVFSVIYTGDWRDFKRGLECDIHNARSGDRVEKGTVDEFISNMRKYKCRDLDAVQQFLAAKFEYLK